MKSVGIIAEFNPLHSGHKYLINEAKKYGIVICVISGNFVQRGDIAIYEKRVRAKSALLAGADIVIELPVCWAMSTAQNFSLGGVSALSAIGCDSIIFGSECGNIDDLKDAACILQSEDFKDKISDHLKKGVTFAAARESAAIDCGLKQNILKGANNNLGIEYIIASNKLEKNFEFLTITRKGAGHDSFNDNEDYVSASLLRKKILLSDYDFCKKYIPEQVFNLYRESDKATISKIELSILSQLRTKNIDDLKKLPDLSEGIENKLYSSIKLATELEQLYNIIKVKRYSHSRIRRLVLSAFLGIDNSNFMKPVPYIRILGFSNKGAKYLNINKNKFDKPIITRVSQIQNLSENSKKIFELECRASDMYALALDNIIPCGIEYTTKIIKTE